MENVGNQASVLLPGFMPYQLFRFLSQVCRYSLVHTNGNIISVAFFKESNTVLLLLQCYSPCHRCAKTLTFSRAGNYQCIFEIEMWPFFGF